MIFYSDKMAEKNMKLLVMVLFWAKKISLYVVDICDVAKIFGEQYHKFITPIGYN